MKNAVLIRPPPDVTNAKLANNNAAIMRGATSRAVRGPRAFISPSVEAAGSLPRRCAEIVAPPSNPTGKELLVNAPVEHIVHGRNARPLGTKRWVQIFITERHGTLFDMAVSIDNTHGDNLHSILFPKNGVRTIACQDQELRVLLYQHAHEPPVTIVSFTHADGRGSLLLVPRPVDFPWAQNSSM